MSERFEREIDDILRRMDWQPPRRQPARPPLGARLVQSLARLWRGYRRRSAVEQLMIASIILWVLSFPLGWIFPGSILVRWASVIGLFCFVAALFLSFTGRGRFTIGPEEKRWRGRVIDYRPRDAGLGWTLRRWWQRLTRR